ncbi:MAG TPA: molybdopterin oxidoreductase, partial [Thermoanaerobaculia bacterium]|nr:molybdopterin oxidoreductase [Thermoanaerobaculia bacterium]
NRPAEKIVPYVHQPEDLIPGKPLFFASAFPLSGFGIGVLAESHMNRPTKIEGNPDHPASLGASDAFMQASVLGLYDPDRSQVVRNLGEISTWSAFIAALQQPLKNPRGMRLLTQTITSPSVGAQIQQLLAQYPGLQWHQWEPVGRDNVREGLRAAFGNYVNAVYRFDKANVIVTLDADCFDRGPAHLRYARDFSARRRVRQGSGNSINRLYAIESRPTGSGAVADHRFPMRASEVEYFARGLYAAINGQTAATIHSTIAKDLIANRGASIVIAGDDQPPVVHAVAMAINQVLGNIGSTVVITDPVEVTPVNQLESLRKLVDDMNNGAVESLVMLGGNPVFDAPADFKFGEAFQKVPFRAHLAHYYNETSMLCHWHVPETHYLEAWSDIRAYDGTISIIQPLIAPLYNGRSVHEALNAMIGGLDVSPYDQVRGFWGPKIGAAFEQSWRQWLNDGVIRNTAMPPKTMTASTTIPPSTQKPQPAIELQLEADPTVYDGRFANLGWLQELPKPHSKITWDNVVLVSPKTMNDLGINDSDIMPLINERQTLLVDINYRGQTLRAPIWPIAGHPDGAATLAFGYGRQHGGRIASPPEGPLGVNVYPLRFSDALSGGGGAQITKADAPAYKIGCTQEHQSINLKDIGGGDRDVIKVASIGEYAKNPFFVRDENANPEEERESMWPQYSYEGQHAWAMVIDPSVCTGCNGCVQACQAENNIPTVGKEQVWRE